MENYMKRKRLIGNLPKIGIRPIIDGRMGGVRESLEVQTMEIAKNLVKYIETNFRHPSGEPVECIIAESTIGGVAESAACQALFEKNDVGASISVTPCWCYGTETMDLTPQIPKAIYGVNGTERPGAVYLAAAGASHDQIGDPVFAIYGSEVQDQDNTMIPEDVKVKIAKFVKAAIGVATIKNKSYLSIGSVSMGIGGSVVNPDFFHDYLGMRNEYVDMSEIKRRLEQKIYDHTEYEKALAWTKENCVEGKEYNVKPQDDATKAECWKITVKMTLIIRDLLIGNKNLKGKYFEESLGHNAILGGYQGQRQWTDFMPNADFPEAILNTSFDWNGIRPPFIFATENDSLNGVAMLLNNMVSQRAQIFSDVRTYWSPEAVKRATGKSLPAAASNGVIHLINSGSTTLDGTGAMKDSKGKPVMKQFWDINEADVKACLKETDWPPAILEYFRGGGYSSHFKTAGGMPVTMSRIGIIKGLGPVLQIAEGHTVELEPAINDVLEERTNPTWPTTWFVPRLTDCGAFKSVYDVMNNWSANHGAISYGHIGADLITLAAMLRIPVSMHNVPCKDIFRPKAWAHHGTRNLEGADFRACKTYGPLYKGNA